MIDPKHVPPVDDDELLARFATQSGQYRKSDYSVKQDLFIPHPRVELSVMRWRDATVEEIWAVGRSVAASLVPPRSLHGRADIQVRACRIDNLRVVATPILPHNPNHADITGWPPAKEDKKALAQMLAAAAGKLIVAPAQA
jgi:hypothetical protein